MQFTGARLDGGECVIRVALLGEQLASDFRRAQPGGQTRGATRGIRLALAINKSLDSGEERGQMVFRTFPPTSRKGIQPREATC
jgi:hypothetical protein